MFGSNNWLQRITALSLALCIVAGITACSDSSGSISDETSAVSETAAETEKPYADDLPETMDMGEQSIRFITSNDKRSLVLDQDTEHGDITDEAIWTRNQALEERFNCKIVLVDETGYDNFVKIVGQSVLAGSDDYDVFDCHSQFCIKCATEGYLFNLNTVDTLDFTKSYWSSLLMDSFSYDGVQFWCTGDISIQYLTFMYAMFVDDTIWTDNYSGDNIYRIVNDGNWTFDLMKTYAEGVYKDVNGNSTADASDVYGFGVHYGHIIGGLAVSMMWELSERDADGNITITVDNPHTYEIYDKLYALLNEETTAYVYDGDDVGMNMFASNQLLFFPFPLSAVESDIFRSMDSNYYIIPNPKYDENQERYNGNHYDGIPIIGIPITVPEDRVENVGTVIEGMASMSSTMVTPVFYETALKVKYSRDEESGQMLDLIHDNISADFAFIWGYNIGQINWLMQDNLSQKKSSIVSVVSGRLKSYNKQLDRILTNLEKYADQNTY